MERPKIRLWRFLPGILLLAISTGIFTTRALSGEQLPPNAELTMQAWDAYNKGDYERAITKAAACIDEFRGGAKREQKQLKDAQTPPPPTGAVSDEQKATIIERGLLNDVATCYYIKGRSAEKLGRREEAKKDYENAGAYTYARCWDPKGWFWSPSEAATDRLEILSEKE